MSRVTVFLARLIGLYMMIVGLSLALRKEESISTISAVTHAPDLLLVLGLLALAAGLAIVLRHNVWSGGALPITVTLLGWLILLRSALLLFLPLQAIADLVDALQIERLFYVYVGIVIVLGFCLTYAGFTSRAGKVPAVEFAK